jgi:hypothetical protein
MPRRTFLGLAAAVPFPVGALERVLAAAGAEAALARPAKRPPVVKVGFLRPRGSSAGAWPGHGFNVDTHCTEWTTKLKKMGEELGVQAAIGADSELVDDPAVARFVAAAKADRPDAIVLVPLGIFHRWDVAKKMVAELAGTPALLFSYIGASFTRDTTPLALKPGCWLAASTDIADLRPGLQMVRTAAMLKQSTLLVIKGGQRRDIVYEKLGTRLRFIPGNDYIAQFKKLDVTEEMRRIADDYAKRAKEVREVKRDQIVNGARHYFAARQLMEAEGADAITSDCLVFEGHIGIPCLAYSKLMDEGVVAGCEADVGSAITMLLLHNLVGTPGFMADPLVDTSKNLFVNAHCTSPTRLGGFHAPPEPFLLRAHHDGTGVAMQVLWRVGQVFTLARFQKPGLLILDRAKVVCNYDSPPAATCVTCVGAVVEGAEDNPHKVGGFHVVQFYGDHTKKVREFCQLYGIEAVHAWDPRVSFEFSPDYP